MDTGCVVDDSSHTTMRLIIDFDVEKATETVLKIPQSGVTGTDKAVFAIARGSGSGKSRVVKEIRRNLLRRDKMLPVDITFNYKSGNEQENVWSEAFAGRRSAAARAAGFGDGADKKRNRDASRSRRRVERADMWKEDPRNVELQSDLAERWRSLGELRVMGAEDGLVRAKEETKRQGEVETMEVEERLV
jgi:hypothetical protein